jgi:WD40 repeat protein
MVEQKSGGSPIQLKLWRTLDGALLKQWDYRPFGSPAFSPDGQFLAIPQENSIEIWRTSDGQVVQSLPVLLGLDTQVEFSPDNRQLGLVIDHAFHLLDLTTGKVLPSPVPFYTESFRWSPDGQWIAAYNLDRTLSLFRPDGSTAKPYVISNINAEYSFSQDGRYLAWTTYRPDSAYFGNLRVVRLADQALVWQRTVFTPNVKPRFTPDSQLLLYPDSPLTIYRTEDGSLFRAYGKTGAPVAFSPDNRVLASADTEMVRLWDAKDGHDLALIWDSPFRTSMAFSPDGQILATTRASSSQMFCCVLKPPVNPDNGVHFFNVSDGREAGGYGAKAPIYTVAFAPDGKSFAFGTGSTFQGELITDNKVRVVLRNGYNTVQSFFQSRYEIMALAYSPDSQVLAVFPKVEEADQPRFYLMNVSDGKILKTIFVKNRIAEPGYFQTLPRARFSSDGQIVILQQNDSIYRWRISDGYSLPRLTGLDLSPDGTVLASSRPPNDTNNAGSLLFSNTDTGKVFNTLNARFFLFAPDNATFALSAPVADYDYWQQPNDRSFGIARIPGTPSGQVLLKPGDVNGDQSITIQDVVLAFKATVGFFHLTPEQVVAGDKNRNDRIDIADVISLLKRVIALNQDPYFPPFND